jgi:hypothetical protein
VAVVDHIVHLTGTAGSALTHWDYVVGGPADLPTAITSHKILRGLVPRILITKALCRVIGMAGTSPAMTAGGVNLIGSRVVSSVEILIESFAAPHNLGVDLMSMTGRF